MSRIEYTEDDVRRFLSFVDRLPGGCWYWMGARSKGQGNRKCYGSFSVGGRVVRAHRFAVEVIGKTPCPPGYHRDHVCRFSMCVNPAHIEVVSERVNHDRKLNPIDPIERVRELEEEVRRLVLELRPRRWDRLPGKSMEYLDDLPFTD